MVFTRACKMSLIILAALWGCNIWNMHQSVLAPQPQRPHSAAICAIQLGALPYVDEWIDYHLALGFEKIYLYDNSEEFELQEWYHNMENDIQRKMSIELVHYPGAARQIPAYNECAKGIKSRKSHSWIAFFDLDEFLVIRDTEKYPYVIDLLDSLPSRVGALAVNWVMFHTNNQTKYEPKPVTYRFRKREENANHIHIKSIVRVNQMKKMANPHFVHYKYFSHARTEDSSGNQVEGSFNHALTDDVVVLYHYHTKSIEEYKRRCGRRQADVVAPLLQDPCKSDSDIRELWPSEKENVLDDATWRLLRERVPKYANMNLH